MKAVEDHVDRVRGAWARERPELDTTPVGVIARIGRAQQWLDVHLDARLAGFGLDRPAWDVLATLRRAGAPHRLSPTELSRSLMRTSGAMTNRVARLERAGLVAREAHPRDGRGLLVRLAPRGRALADAAAPAHLDHERALLAGLAAEEQDALAALLRKLLVSLERDHPLPVRDRRRTTA